MTGIGGKCGTYGCVLAVGFVSGVLVTLGMQHTRKISVKKLTCLDDYESEAKKRIPHAFYEWIAEGAADERTLEVDP